MTNEAAQALDWLVRHCYSLSIEVNPHRAYYQSVRDYLTEQEVNPDTITACESVDTVVQVQVYPETAIGFCLISGPTLSTAILEAKQAVEARFEERYPCAP